MALQNTENIKQIVYFLMSVGATKAGAIGMAANCYAESRCDPMCVEALLIQRYKQEGFLKWNYGLYDENTYKQYWEYYKSGAISKAEFLSPRQYTGTKHQYGAGICQWTTKARKERWISIAEDDKKPLTDLDVQLNLLYWELKNTYTDVWNVIHLGINIDVVTNYVLRHFESPANAGSLLNTRIAYAKEIEKLISGGTTVKKASDLNPDDWIVAVKAVADYARTHGYKYGDSHATPPTADKIISCDRLVARALWDRGFTDQPVSTTTTSGITVGSMDKYLTAHGFEKGTSFSDIRKGSIVLVGTQTAPTHTFVTVSYDAATKTFVKYDCGSQARINAVQPFTEKWAYPKLYAVYNIPQKKEVSKPVSITIGSARIDENGHAHGGRAGDQTGKEVSEQAYYLHSGGWRAFRLKDAGQAAKIAEGMRSACNNSNWGYDQYERTSGMKKVAAYGYNPAKLSTPAETDCSNLVRTCFRYATGKDTGDFDTSGEASALKNTGLVTEITFNQNTGSGLCVGDILVTRRKGHTVIVTGGPQRSSSGTTNTAGNGSQSAGGNYMFSLPLIKRGSKNNAVLLFQEIFNARNTAWKWGQKNLTLDGECGADTENAIRWYQKQRKLTVDGQCGQATWKDIIAI